MREDTVPEGQYDFEPLAREIVVNRLADAPAFAAAAAKTARDIILPALKATLPSQQAKITTFQVCRGIMTGIIALDKAPCETCVAILAMTAEIAQEGNLAPADLMTWAMEGIASIVALFDRHDAEKVETAIESRFAGAGYVFAELCRKYSG
ncbi:MAG: hypothetical protein WC943_16905 [Elusimicrobiota bacterium]